MRSLCTPLGLILALVMVGCGVGIVAAALGGDVLGMVQVLLLTVIAALVVDCSRRARSDRADHKRLLRRLRRLQQQSRRSAHQLRVGLDQIRERDEAAASTSRSVLVDAVAALSLESRVNTDRLATATADRTTLLAQHLDDRTAAVTAALHQLERGWHPVESAFQAQNKALGAITARLRRLESGDTATSLRMRVAGDLAALLALHSQRTSVALPVPTGWAMSPRVLELVVRTVRSRPDLHTVVELGSGVSTSWVSEVLAQRGSGRLVSFEHDEGFAAVTSAYVAEVGAEKYVDLRCAPLTEVMLDGSSYRWYQRYDDLEDIGILVVDGPPGDTGPLARYPAAPLLLEKMAIGGVVILDDVEREDEEHIADRWQQLRVGGRRLRLVQVNDRAAVFRVDVAAPGT